MVNTRLSSSIYLTNADKTLLLNDMTNVDIDFSANTIRLRATWEKKQLLLIGLRFNAQNACSSVHCAPALDLSIKTNLKEKQINSSAGNTAIIYDYH